MERAAPLCLWFDDGLPEPVRARIEYAFRTFCAVYRRPCDVVSGAYPPQGALRYGIDIPAKYRPRPPSEPAPAPVSIPLAPDARYRPLGITRMPLFHGSPARIDWLGEIFEWLSSAHEYSVIERDNVGRIPFSATLHGRYGLDPAIPYASVAMYEFARKLWIVPGQQATRIGASHDLGHVSTSARGDARRLVKNVGVALIDDRDLRLAVGIIVASLRGAFRRRSPLDYLQQMRERERKRGIASTANVICRNTCPRDGNYAVDDPRVVRQLRELESSGAEVGVHGSYMSLRDGGFGQEVETLRDLGFDVRGGRAHWLRYAGSTLFDAVAASGLAYDASAGFSDRVGFRAGASFAYRPYDFATERAYSFYEIPLAIMDGALYAQARREGRSPRAIGERVLDMTDAFPSGGVSVLWHNTAFEGGQLPLEIGRLYWDLPRAHQRWTTHARIAADEAHWFENAFAPRETAQC